MFKKNTCVIHCALLLISGTRLFSLFTSVTLKFIYFYSIVASLNVWVKTIIHFLSHLATWKVTWKVTEVFYTKIFKILHWIFCGNNFLIYALNEYHYCLWMFHFYCWFCKCCSFNKKFVPPETWSTNWY